MLLLLLVKNSKIVLWLLFFLFWLLGNFGWLFNVIKLWLLWIYGDENWFVVIV